MALTYGFYDSIGGDRKYNALEMSSIFDGIITDGIIQAYGDGFKVFNGPSSNEVIVGTGRAWLDHTWTYNSSNYSIILPSASPSLNTTDYICIKVDSTNRENSIINNRNSIPANCYPIASVYRRAGSTSIADGDITDLRGYRTPWAYSLVNEYMYANIPEMHNVIYRGKNLGSVFTSAQKQAIVNGTFNDLYIGDYWRINNVNYYISDLFLVNKPIMRLFPSTGLVNIRMNNNAYNAANLLSDAGTAFVPATFSSTNPATFSWAITKGSGDNDGINVGDDVARSIDASGYLQIPTLMNLFGMVDLRGRTWDLYWKFMHTQSSLLRIKPGLLADANKRKYWIDKPIHGKPGYYHNIETIGNNGQIGWTTYKTYNWVRPFIYISY